MEPRTTGNHGVSKRDEKAQIKKLLSQREAICCPCTTGPAKIEHSMVVGRMHDAVPGPVVQIAAEAQLVSGVTRESADDPHRDALRVRATDRRLRAGRPARHRLHLHRRADLASGRSLSPVLRHAGRRAAALGRARRRARGAAAVEQAQRHDLRRRPEPDRLRARDLEPGARTAGRAARGARVAFRRAGAQLAERCLRALRRLDLFLRSLVRPHAGLRRRAAAPARLPGRLSHAAGRRRSRSFSSTARASSSRTAFASRPTRSCSTSTTPSHA